MTYSEIASIAKEAVENKIITNQAYDHFAEGTNPKPPFCLFSISRSNNFGADGIVYQKIVQVQYELYSDKKRPDVETAFEGILDSHGLFFNKSETWLPTEQMFCNIYTTEVLYDEKQD